MLVNPPPPKKIKNKNPRTSKGDATNWSSNVVKHQCKEYIMFLANHYTPPKFPRTKQLHMILFESCDYIIVYTS